MSAEPSVTMTDDERDASLGNGGFGVISLDTDSEEPPHSIPVSYGYDASTRTFYFRIAAGGDSQKGVLPGRPASFVTYGQDDDDRWWSVVAKGELESTTEASIATETLAGLDWVHIPLVDIFGRPPRAVSFEFYRLDPDRLTARKESPSGV